MLQHRTWLNLWRIGCTFWLPVGCFERTFVQGISVRSLMKARSSIGSYNFSESGTNTVRAVAVSDFLTMHAMVCLLPFWSFCHHALQGAIMIFVHQQKDRGACSGAPSKLEHFELVLVAESSRPGKHCRSEHIVSPISLEAVDLQMHQHAPTCTKYQPKRTFAVLVILVLCTAFFSFPESYGKRQRCPGSALQSRCLTNRESEKKHLWATS